MCFCTAVSPGRNERGMHREAVWEPVEGDESVAAQGSVWSRRENHGGSETREAGGPFALEKIAPLAWAQKLVLKLGRESGLRAPDFEPAAEKGTW